MARNRFLQISLTNKCNFSCWHCPMHQWRNSATPKWPLDNATLIPWIKDNIIPGLWIIELTGGEPALYPELDELCKFLSENNYKVLIKTNGSLPIKSYPNIKRVAAFHQLDNPPKYFDEILIVDKIDSDMKQEICKKNNWKYHVIGYNTENPDNAKHEFKSMAYINPAGHQLGCYAQPPLERILKDNKDHNRIDFKALISRKPCPHCKPAIDAWRFIDGLV